MQNHSNTQTVELTVDAFDKFRESFSKSLDRRDEYMRRQAVIHEKRVKFYDWLHKNCTEDKILFIGELVLNDFLLPSEFHKELKPWIDRYEKETK